MPMLPEEQPEQAPQDYAIADVEHGFVLLEANEWTEKTCRHWVVTLLLHPEEARMLAVQLNRCADEAERQAKSQGLN